MIAIIVIAGLYSVMIVGITGGPNNGEHPVIITGLHLAIFFSTTDSWPVDLHDLYFKLLLFCMAGSFVGFGNYDYATFKIRFWVARGMIFMAYVGFVIIYLSVHGVMTLPLFMNI